MKNVKDWCYIVFAISLTTGCSWFGFGGGTKPTSTDKVVLPKVGNLNPPGGTAKNWRYLGTSDDGQLIVEINDPSINEIKPQIYKYQDRKTVTNPNKFTAYLSGQPHYKYLISNWQINCNSKEYLIIDTTLYNESAIQIMSYDYSNNNDIKWIKVGTGSLASLQHDYICLSKNRNLGY